MFKINRLKVEIITDFGNYGIDEKFSSGLNFLASNDNTCGKSSVIEAIYYALGFEEIIGGKGEKVLTSVYKNFLEDGKDKIPVQESKVFLEITNGLEIVTLYRIAKDSNRDSKLITIYHSSMDKIYDDDTFIENKYVHMQQSATNNGGFHTFLEKFLNLSLPRVPSTDGKQRKLYLQLIFSCMFIEQKHGWGDIFSGIPLLGIKDSKKRVIEYVLNLETVNIENKKELLKFEEKRITSEWKMLIKEIQNAVDREFCFISDIPLEPCEFTLLTAEKIHIFKNDIEINEYIQGLKDSYNKIELMKPRVVDNFDDMQKELDKTEVDIQKFEKDVTDLRSLLSKEENMIEVLEKNLELVEIDLQNNKDAAKLKKLGAEIGSKLFDSKCPVCNQIISDSLLPIEENNIMSIDENIRHLDAQKNMLLYAKGSHNANKVKIEKQLQFAIEKVISLRKLAIAIRDDIYSVSESVSESIVYKKMEILNNIEKLEILQKYIDKQIKSLLFLGKDWKTYLTEKKKIPKRKFTNSDFEKINVLKSHFVENLSKYGYKSIANMDAIQISEESYLPIIEEFDMKFDSSASDNIRAIWAYTIALMQTSIEKKGNHPGVVIFDEPNQHSIISEDMEKFFNSLIELGNNVQIIVGITIKDSDTRKEIEKLPNESYHLIEIANKAFQKLM
ncbi:hypothetical protein AAAY24_06295 [Faecalibacillus faecis]|uniref:hypothetical protein n=1 Tax=Faecalibacillus faecis TaxID=1982628 RepID=UPI0032C04823